MLNGNELYIVEFLAELNEWGPVFTLWSNSEDKVSLALGAIAKAVEKNFIALQELVCPSVSSFSFIFYSFDYNIDLFGLRRKRTCFFTGRRHGNRIVPPTEGICLVYAGSPGTEYKIHSSHCISALLCTQSEKNCISYDRISLTCRRSLKGEMQFRWNMKWHTRS